MRVSDAVQPAGLSLGQSKGDLIFASSDRSPSGYYLFAWTYPKGHFVEGFGQYIAGIWMCSDKSGNVWLAADAARELIEFDHSGSVIKRLGDENYNRAPWACSVDPQDGTVAAINIDGGDLVVYRKGSDSGTAFPTGLVYGYSCAYDDRGNLFGVGINREYKGQLVELPRGSNTVRNISLNEGISGDRSMQWDGHYLAIQTGAHNDHTSTILQVQVSGSNGTVVGKTYLSGPSSFPNEPPQFWIYHATIMEAVGTNAEAIGLWKYPQGGKPLRVFRRSVQSHAYYVDGITVSVAPSSR